MPSFVKDMHLHVRTAEGDTSVEAPPDANTGKFLDDLRAPLHLASQDAEGRRIHWHIYNREGRKLDPSRTLSENGVGEGHELVIRSESEEALHEEREEEVFEKRREKEDARVLIRCDNGHFYDPKKNSTCPYCGVAASDATVPKKESVAAAREEIGSTRPAGGFTSTPDAGRSSDLTMRAVIAPTSIDPVVGWLVCMHGPEKGKDYRIRSENNTIGRSDDMYISIKDDMISRERHAYITFDPQTNKFYLRPGEARGLVHRNGNVVFQAEELQAYDQILLGRTKLVFVPLCGEHFKWE